LFLGLSHDSRSHEQRAHKSQPDFAGRLQNTTSTVSPDGDCATARSTEDSAGMGLLTWGPSIRLFVGPGVGSEASAGETADRFADCLFAR
jgi:hypothetical protein